MQTIIGSLSKEEARNYKLFINRTHPGESRKDALLFDLVKKQYPGYDEAVIQRKLYGKEDKNALYRLKNRVLDDLSKSTTLHYFNRDDVRRILYLIALALHFRSKGLAKVAFYFLGKAEKKAVSDENHQLLDLVYSEFIKLSHETLAVNPEEYIRKRKANNEKLESLRQIDDILAAIIYRIKISQNLGGANSRILSVLQKTVSDFSKDSGLKKNPALRFKIYESVSRILLQKNDFASLEKYLYKTFEEFTKERLFSRNNHDIKLQMLTYLANSLFKNENYQESLKVAQKLRSAMEEYDRMLYDKYLGYYYNTLVINYSQTDVRKAIVTLNEARDNPVIQKLPIYDVFIHLNLAVTHFDVGEYKTALKNLVRFTMSASFQNLDVAFRLKVSIVELMIRFELDDHEYVLHRIQQVRKDFHRLLRGNEFRREKMFLELFPGMIASPGLRRDAVMRKKIGKFLAGNRDTSSDIINYNNWLRTRIGA